ncbi:MAG: heavy metal translocating P-type ATPase [Pseudomonadota bacterium]
MAADGETCFHCLEPLPARGRRAAEFDGAPRDFCCAGCEAAALLIRDAGLLDYYRVRSAPARRADDATADWSTWDGEAVQAAHSRAIDRGREITVLVEGIRCAACAWLIEHALGREPGVLEVRVNPSTGRATVAWDPAVTRLGAVLARLARLGYLPHLPGADDAAATRERRRALKRLVVAGLGMMQGMMFAEALYFGDGGGMDLATRDFFRWIGLSVATPVVFCAGWPFLRGAWIEWRQRRPAMDLLVATTILVAWLASVVETLRGGPAVYFDSAVMFVFLLLATRHLEQAARRRANAAVEVLARAQPQTARRIGADGATGEVPVHALRAGDVVRVRHGEAVPADGVLLAEAGAFDEALLTGESRPVVRRAGEAVFAGSVCVDSPTDVRVARTGAETTLAQIVRLVERAQSSRPRIALVADRIASRFVVVLFGATALVAGAWLAIDPSQALPIALAVLAVSCPCALSLAVPAGLAATHARLAREGLLVLRPDALETLAAIDTVVLDKTGTLTTGRMRLTGVRLLREVPRERVLAVAAALECDSLHPAASALRGFADENVVATSVRAVAGAGVEGTIDGEMWRIGSAAFAAGAIDDEGGVWLADARGAVARLDLGDEIRHDAAAALAALRALGVDLQVLSGDAPGPVGEVAARVGIGRWQARRAPQDKLAAIRALQAGGRRVAMVGDGINDAAVLAGADVSVAMAEGASLAHAAADVVLAAPRLGALPVLLAAARDTQRIARQNLGWAAGYNAIGLLLAAFGWVPPWAAAIGMSVSSLAVTLNALRLAAPGRAARSERWAPRAEPIAEATR